MCGKWKAPGREVQVVKHGLLHFTTPPLLNLTVAVCQATGRNFGILTLFFCFINDVQSVCNMTKNDEVHNIPHKKEIMEYYQKVDIRSVDKILQCSFNSTEAWTIDYKPIQIWNQIYRSNVKYVILCFWICMCKWNVCVNVSFNIYMWYSIISEYIVIFVLTFLFRRMYV